MRLGDWPKRMMSNWSCLSKDENPATDQRIHQLPFPVCAHAFREQGTGQFLAVLDRARRVFVDDFRVESIIYLRQVGVVRRLIVLRAHPALKKKYNVPRQTLSSVVAKLVSCCSFYMFSNVSNTVTTNHPCKRLW